MHICFATHIVWGFVSKCGSSVYYTLSRHRVRRLLWHVPSVSTYLEGVIQQFTKKMWMARIEIVWCHCVCVCVYFANGNVRRWWFRCYVWKLVDDGTQWYGTIQHDGVHAIWKCCVHNTFGYFRNRFCTVDETINTRTMNILSCWSSVARYSHIHMHRLHITTFQPGDFLHWNRYYLGLGPISSHNAQGTLFTVFSVQSVRRFWMWQSAL